MSPARSHSPNAERRQQIGDVPDGVDQRAGIFLGIVWCGRFPRRGG
jgi:hypothetical protein